MQRNGIFDIIGIVTLRQLHMREGISKMLLRDVNAVPRNDCDK
jgi:hypothetical protein